ncbi:hypothetical protein OS189_12615 [Sulfitobacter sp. F26169L]|uniref:DUF4145 domain-containing protein n=1 Tax=Sulfitobacter sp. F26169L TaxID=2996015 RepID=UPI002260E036|nr:hypothetical protein [Sulfitobacter sp. F26169L]MCX7567187.1 hypothetical protein [Sulfitobacter sp. F26169L]
MSGELICSHAACGEIVGFSAIGGVDHDPYENTVDKFFRIKAIYPAPWIIELPKELPDPIRKPLIASFESYWANKQLCANAIRQSIEALLDHHKVSRTSVKDKRLPLGGRIDLLKEIKPEFSELFELFRPFLNAGSHGEEIEIASLLNVFEALEIHLSQVFDTKSNRLDELKALMKKASESE